MDKKLKILSCLQYDEYITVEELYQRSGIKDIKKFGIIFDELGNDHYLRSKGDLVGLYTLSSVSMYTKRRFRSRIVFALTLIGTIAAVIAALPVIIDVFTKISSSP